MMNGCGQMSCTYALDAKMIIFAGLKIRKVGGEAGMSETEKAIKDLNTAKMTFADLEE